MCFKCERIVSHVCIFPANEPFVLIKLTDANVFLSCFRHDLHDRLPDGRHPGRRGQQLRHRLRRPPPSVLVAARRRRHLLLLHVFPGERVQRRPRHTTHFRPSHFRLWLRSREFFRSPTRPVRTQDGSCDFIRTDFRLHFRWYTPALWWWWWWVQDEPSWPQCVFAVVSTRRQQQTLLGPRELHPGRV